MSARDQPFNDPASAFWGHHRLFVEQFARIASQGQFGLQLSDPFMGGCQRVGVHTRGAVDDSGVDKRLAFPPEQCCLADSRLSRDDGHRLARSKSRDDLPAN
ncbi:hypothetical protein AFA91_29590 [Mycolicibacterium goodii]|uniref:Uncharacterized protein n=1 Tax=Mycolicibacterium goodii TaxID=134601 RepID=A0A0K0XD75_MYCGD|nr:hypothetical protein AFA91_29590 [Mycolicibacterium goodii]